MKIITPILDKKELIKELDFIISFFITEKCKKIVVWFGYGCNTEDLYEETKFTIDEFESFIEKIQKNNIFILGGSDLFIADSKKNFEFLLCHESDIHFESKNLNLLNKVKKHWQKKGYKFYKAKKAKTI